jgi:hypothetical protein
VFKYLGSRRYARYGAMLRTLKIRCEHHEDGKRRRQAVGRMIHDGKRHPQDAGGMVNGVDKVPRGW